MWPEPGCPLHPYRPEPAQPTPNHQTTPVGTGRTLKTESMKKLVALLCALCVAGTLSAQEKHIVGIRAGMNVSNMTFKQDGMSISPSSRVSFQVGGSYQYNFLESMPFYLETGLYLSLKGAEQKVERTTTTIRMTYLEVPIMVNYHWNISDKISIIPAAGFYYSLGLGGTTEAQSGDTSVKADTFGTDSYFKRSEFGMRFGASVEFLENFFAGVGYDVGFNNLSKDADVKLHNGCFFVLVGYNFKF